MRMCVLRLFLILSVSIAALIFMSVEACADNYRMITVNNGIELNAPLKIVDNTVYVPLRSVLEAFKWEIYWDPVKKEILSIKDEGRIIVSIDKTQAFVNGNSFILDKPPVIIDGLAYIEGRFIAQNFGVNISWNKKDNLIITSNSVNDVKINGSSNIVIAGNSMIVNITQAYGTDTLYDMINEADTILGRGFAENSLQKYKEILGNISEEDSPDLKAHIINNMGNAYAACANIKDLKSNMLHAISEYEKALDYYEKEGEKTKYHMVSSNLANAYGLLGEATGDYDFINKSIREYNKTIAFFWSEKSMLDYAVSRYNIGRLYYITGDVYKGEENLSEAEGACNTILNSGATDKDPALYAVVQFNLGNIYKVMSELSGQRDLLDKSKTGYEEALKVWTVESDPNNYANAHRCIGDIYKMMLKYGGEESEENLKKSQKAYEEALKIKTLEKYPLENAEIQYNMGDIHMHLYEIYNRHENIKLALECYSKALTVFDKEQITYRIKLIEKKKSVSYMLQEL
ncbi:MAG: hypothetical protein GX660_04600 [Clostridiaceae bacterium]|nr:hypothetical protein [Clostridiaceae bacterium]